MIKDIQELNFPQKDGKQYATLTHADVQIVDMGEKAITTQVKIDGDIVPDFSYDWAVVFKGEKYIQPLRKPQGAKENTSLNATVDLTFQHWAIWQLKRYPFVTIQPIQTGNYIADEEVASVQLNLGDLCNLFGQVLEYYYGDKITIDLNPNWQYDNTATLITISHTKIWNVLIDAFYQKHGVRWEIVPSANNDNTTKDGERYTIKVGYPTTEVDHIFEYGFKGGLLKVEQQVQSDEIRNVLKGRGGEKNVPFRYFKSTDPNNPDFAADPDWVEELANASFPNLMGATFRSYVQGWKAAHISKYAGYTAVGEANAYAPWAYRKGYTDEKFSPVEFVADEITITPEAGDKQVEVLPDYTPYVKKDSSIARYGAFFGTLDNNDEIYPTFQGTGWDIAVDVEQVKTDDTSEDTETDAVTTTLQKVSSNSADIAANARVQIEMRSTNFTIPTGKHGNINEGAKTFNVTKDGNLLSNVFGGKFTSSAFDFSVSIGDFNVGVENASIVVANASTGAERSASGIPAGTYYFKVKMTIHNTTNDKISVKVSCDRPQLTTATINPNAWKGTFDIWVKNIWNTQKGVAANGTTIPNETDTDYANRVWKPILGDREDNKAKVVFTSGNLVHEDYEFVITDIPTPDTSKAWTDEDGTTHKSEWRITLAKSDAELDATGLYVPNTKKQGKAGDTFAFIGTEMTHVPYVTDAEKRLDDWKKDNLLKSKEIAPTFIVTTDRVRINNEGKPNALIDSLRVGNVIHVADKRFITDVPTEALYLQSVTYKYREPSSDDAALNPDVDIVLGNEYTVSASPISIMQGEISAIQKQIGSISNVAQVVRKVGDRVYLRKDIDDIAAGMVTFLRESRLNQGAQFGSTFAPGLYGYGGRIDGAGYGELRGLRLWEWLEVPEIRLNRVQYVLGLGIRAKGGGIIEDVVIDTTTDSDGNTVNAMTGAVYLKLEDGEYGAVEVDDMHMGLWHDMGGGNATAPKDDRKGTYEMRGFKTVYFRVTDIPATDPYGKDNSDQHYFRYALRPLSDGGNGVHPYAMMHFGLRGNFTKKDRQDFVYETTEYKMKLTGVNTWTFQGSNIYYISGILDGFTMEQVGDDGNTYVKHFSGYGTVLGNAYIYGTIDMFERAAVTMEITNAGDGFLAWGEACLISCRVKKAFQDLTSKVVKWEISRDTGDAAEDSAWILKQKVKDFNGEILISHTKDDDDLSKSDKVLSTLFTIKATLEDETQLTGELTVG